MSALPKIRYLTKSRFVEAWSCPTKLFYTGKKAEYGSTALDNSFLEALAEGGFQVGALAKLYFPGGVEIGSLDPDEAIAQTRKLMERDEVILHEAAISHGHLLARVDVLVKRGSQVQLIEVKAKSYDAEEDQDFLLFSREKKGAPSGEKRITGLSSKWEPYLIDVAFQLEVFLRSYPELKVAPFLMLADKNALTTVEGLNQKFVLTRDKRGRTQVDVKAGPEDLGDRILIQKEVQPAMQFIFGHIFEGQRFVERIDAWAAAYADDRRNPPLLGKRCRDCEYRIPEEMKTRGLQSGFERCWKEAAGLGDEDFKRPLSIDLWDYRRDDLVEQRKFLLEQVEQSDLESKSKSKNGNEDSTVELPTLSRTDRQWLQIRKVKESDPTPELRRRVLSDAFSKFQFPLHMIDFETTRVAIPFFRGNRPYEGIAFQFSHHLVHEDGRIEHRTEYLERRRGVFPNFDFVRALKSALGERGSIFRYSAHENTVLCEILRQLENARPTEADPLSDRGELAEWIRAVTCSPKSRDGQEGFVSWEGPRSMIDLLELLKQAYYHPRMEGSNSLKAVLPAILNESRELQQKYSRPVYGTAQMPSHNFSSHAWIRIDPASGQVVDPYKRLGPIFETLEEDQEVELMMERKSAIQEGGAAMTAYARMQFSEMGDAEREKICQALLRYCELDTFAMVLLYEHWRELLR